MPEYMSMWDLYQELKNMDREKYKEVMLNVCSRCAARVVENGFIPNDARVYCAACYVMGKFTIVGGLERLCKEHGYECEDVIRAEVAHIGGTVLVFGVGVEKIAELVEKEAEEI